MKVREESEKAGLKLSLKKTKIIYSVDGHVNGYSHYGEQYGVKKQTKNRATI